MRETITDVLSVKIVQLRHLADGIQADTDLEKVFDELREIPKLLRQVSYLIGNVPTKDYELVNKINSLADAVDTKLYGDELNHNNIIAEILDLNIEIFTINLIINSISDEQFNKTELDDEGRLRLQSLRSTVL